MAETARRQPLDNLIDSLAHVHTINAIPGVLQHDPRPLGCGLSGSNAHLHVNESQWKPCSRPTVVPAEVTGVYVRAAGADLIDDFLFDPLHALKSFGHGYDDCHEYPSEQNPYDGEIKSAEFALASAPKHRGSYGIPCCAAFSTASITAENPGDVAMVDNDVHAVKMRFCVCGAARFVSLSDGAKRAKRPL